MGKRRRTRPSQTQSRLDARRTPALGAISSCSATANWSSVSVALARTACSLHLVLRWFPRRRGRGPLPSALTAMDKLFELLLQAAQKNFALPLVPLALRASAKAASVSSSRLGRSLSVSSGDGKVDYHIFPQHFDRNIAILHGGLQRRS